MSLKDLLAEVGLDAAQIYDVVPSAIFTVDNQKRITSWNKRAAEITGYSQEEALGRSCDILGSRACKARCGLFTSSIHKPLRDRECDITTKDGQRKLVSKSSDLLRDKDGRIIGGVESFEDITERKKALEILHRRAEIVNYIDHPIYVVNKNLTYLFANNKLLERLHFDSVEEIVGKGYDQFHTEEQTREFALKVMEVFETGKTLRYEYKSFRDKQEKYYRTLSPNKNARGEVVTVTISSDEISALKSDTLQHFITICAYCKKIRDEKGDWVELEAYFSSRTDCQFSHGMCPLCSIDAYKELDLLRPVIL